MRRIFFAVVSAVLLSLSAVSGASAQAGDTAVVLPEGVDSMVITVNGD